MTEKDRKALFTALAILGLTMLGLFLLGVLFSTGYAPWYLM